MPLVVLILTAIAVSVVGRAGPAERRPPRFHEILYGLTSQGNNNGSAFDGLTGNTPFYNIIGAIDMFIGRFGIMIPALALGGSLAAKDVVPESLGTFRTDNGMFVGLTIGVILIIGGLDLLPRHLSRPRARAVQPHEVLLMTTVTQPPTATPSEPHGVAQAQGTLRRTDSSRGAEGVVKKLDPRVQVKNPVMFVVLVGSVITFVEACAHPSTFTWSITIWLFLTVVFANFAEAMAEGRGKAQADTLRKMRSETEARLLKADGSEELVPAANLTQGRPGRL